MTRQQITRESPPHADCALAHHKPRTRVKWQAEWTAQDGWRWLTGTVIVHRAHTRSIIVALDDGREVTVACAPVVAE